MLKKHNCCPALECVPESLTDEETRYIGTERLAILFSCECFNLAGQSVFQTNAKSKDLLND